MCNDNKEKMQVQLYTDFGLFCHVSFRMPHSFICIENDGMILFSSQVLNIRIFRVEIPRCWVGFRSAGPFFEL